MNRMTMTHPLRCGAHHEPTPTWLVATDPLDGQRYIVHTIPPAFIAKVTAGASEANHNPNAALLANRRYPITDHHSIYDFVWLGDLPNDRTLDRIIQEAARVLEHQDAATETKFD